MHDLPYLDTNNHTAVPSFRRDAEYQTILSLLLSSLVYSIFEGVSYGVVFLQQSNIGNNVNIRSNQLLDIHLSSDISKSFQAYLECGGSLAYRNRLVCFVLSD